MKKNEIKWERWEDVKKELLKDPEVKAEYDKLGPQYDLISKLIGARIKKGLTQAELAKKIGTKQSAIARLESGNANPSILFLRKITAAMGRELVIEIK